jgi:hypothetical protein
MTNTQSVLSDLTRQQFGTRYVASVHDDVVARAAAAIDADPTPENVEAVVRSEVQRLGTYVPQSFIDSVVNSVSTPVEAEADEESMTYLTDAGSMTYLTDAQVAALVEAASGYADEETVKGIIDNAGLLEPQPEPEPEVEDDATLIQRLVEFAKRFGFKG